MMRTRKSPAGRSAWSSPKGWSGALTTRVGVSTLAGLLLLSTGADVAGQDRPRRGEAPTRWVQQAERGWIGVSFDITAVGRAPREAIRITDVREGSPAAEAGLRAGDRVLAVNQLETPRELAALPELLSLRAGDPVVMVVERGGERLRVRMLAAPRPGGFTPGREVEVLVRADSMVESLSRSMDSLRIHLRTDEGRAEVRLRRLGEREGSRGVAVLAGGSDHVVRPPFEYFLFRGEEHDSLRHEMVRINSVVVSLEEQIRARERELRSQLRSTEDQQLHDLRARLQRVSSRSEELESAMAEAARSSAGLRYDVVAPGERTSEAVDHAAGEFRPLTPYLLGRNRVAGAEVIDLEPELARYFDVTGGVLITKVAPGTPAAMAGLLPGDVVTRIDRVTVKSVEELRYGVSVAGDTLPLTLIREGESRQVLLRRR